MAVPLRSRPPPPQGLHGIRSFCPFSTVSLPNWRQASSSATWESCFPQPSGVSHANILHPCANACQPSSVIALIFSSAVAGGAGKSHHSTTAPLGLSWGERVTCSLNGDRKVVVSVDRLKTVVRLLYCCPPVKALIPSTTPSAYNSQNGRYTCYPDLFSPSVRRAGLVPHHNFMM
ncbi:unnamed protein product [Schistocephalus solidus]|uniref:Uncharacterized protein n=1 Tax=Schistocephalus solidus TaxID=70667 RepID=A0A183T3R3_SCHSO|nr:unnamed protein product [Schistocephalus solidus]